MWKKFKSSYVGQCLARAFWSSWDSANNLAGTVIGGGLALLVPLPIIAGATDTVKWENSAISLVIYTIGAWIILLLLRAIFASPYQIWKDMQLACADSPAIQVSRELVEAQREHTEELRRQRQAAERENHPVLKAFRAKQEEALNRQTSPKIVIGEGINFEKTKSHKLYYLNRVISIAVTNDGTRFVSNCKFYIETSDDKNEQRTYLLVDSFTLNATETKYIQIASYNEPVPPQLEGGKHIQLCTPPSGGFFDTSTLLSPDRKHVITLRLTTLETSAVEMTCYLWVNDKGQLKLEKA